MDCEGIEDQVILSLGDPLRRQTDTASILTNQCSETEASVFNSRYSSLTTRLLLLILAWPYAARSSTVEPVPCPMPRNDTMEFDSLDDSENPYTSDDCAFPINERVLERSDRDN